MSTPGVNSEPAGGLAGELLQGDQWQGLLRLAGALRRAIQLTIDTDASPAELDAMATAVEGVVARLEAAPTGRQHVPFAEPIEPGGRRARIDTAPLIGAVNPAAPPLQVVSIGDVVRATAVYGVQYEGPPGSVHGGIIAATLDEIVGMAQSLSGRGGMTGTLRVRYHRPTPLFREIQLESRVDRIEGRKIFTVGTISVDGELCAEAEAVFISVDWDRLRKATGRP